MDVVYNRAAMFIDCNSWIDVAVSSARHGFERHAAYLEEQLRGIRNIDL